MKILHICQPQDDMVMRHVNILLEGMRNSADVRLADSLQAFSTILQEQKPDIVHCHGAGRYLFFRAAQAARKRGARVVVSPHGQLEPWVATTMSKSMPLQRRYIEKAYAVITFGKMECRNMQALGWNPRLEMVKNSVVTNSISPKDMCSKTFAVYQKILDSNVLEQMNEPTRRLLAILTKAGITGDRRWFSSGTPGDVAAPSDDIDWRRLLIYAEHENIRNYIDYGMSVMGIKPTVFLDTTKVAAYFPPSYRKPESIKHIIGEYKGDETDYLVRMIAQIQHAPILLHLIELSRELRRDTVDDDALSAALQDKGKALARYTSQLVQVLAEQTLLEEGFWPLPPLDNQGTKRIRNSITNHLKI